MQKGAHFHRRNLPHIYMQNTTYFITFRLKGSIPKIKIKELVDWKDNLTQAKTRNEKYRQDLLFFGKYDKLLDNNKKIQHLKNPKVANVVAKELHKYNNKEYSLICYSIMPNHVHLVFSLLENSNSIDKIMQNIKRISAFYANQILNKKGHFWQSESYDHIIRDEDELQRIVDYSIYNPVKAKLVDEWFKWDYTYFKYG